jgi:hypothetical protein
LTFVLFCHGFITTAQAVRLQSATDERNAKSANRLAESSSRKTGRGSPIITARDIFT